MATMMLMVLHFNNGFCALLSGFELLTVQLVFFSDMDFCISTEKR